MTRLNRLSIAIFLLIALSSVLARAQGDTLSEDEFWSRLEQTGKLLDSPGLPSPETIAEIDSLWDGVEFVRVGDDLLPVDPRWITGGASSRSETTVSALRDYIDAMLAMEGRQANAGDAPSLDTLRDVLNDPRFQYDPQPEPEPSLPDIAPPSADIGQLILIIAVVIVAVAVVVYLMRTMQVQPRTLDTPDDEEDPRTSADAQSMANARESERDYRNAIRYLFLALLLSLDERGLIHYDPTLTNREHLRQIRENTRLADLLRPVVTTFDDVWYGFIPIDETGYRDFARQVDQLKALVA